MACDNRHAAGASRHEAVDTDGRCRRTAVKRLAEVPAGLAETVGLSAAEYGHAHAGDAACGQADDLGGGLGKIDDAAGDERATIIDADLHAAAAAQVRHANASAKR